MPCAGYRRKSHNFFNEASAQRSEGNYLSVGGTYENPNYWCLPVCPCCLRSSKDGGVRCGWQPGDHGSPSNDPQVVEFGVVGGGSPGQQVKPPGLFNLVALRRHSRVRQTCRTPIDRFMTAGTHDNAASGLQAFTDRIFLGDSMTLMPQLPDESIDLILADLPYGTSRNKWDSVLDLTALWAEYERLIKPRGAIVLTAAQPFTSVLVCSNLRMFKYEWIWSKTVGSGQLNTKRQPLRTHESVLVFYKKQPTYNPQMESGEPYVARRKTSSWAERGYNTQRDHTVVNSGERFPKSVLPVSNPRHKGGHPTQKPVALFEYLIRTYTNPGELVLDNVIGSGTTAVAAIRTGRHFIGMELNPDYARMAQANVDEAFREQGDCDGSA